MVIKYRPDIDGLRAIAVLSVIFFHTGISGFSGGFVGVDVFFVISGYLITSIILKDIKSGEFSIARFYERRIRRIFPPLFTVITFTVVVSAFLFDSNSFESFGRSITATTFFCSNVLFWKESGYFDASSITKPLLHTWSLAVEEQFYIFFPLLLIGITRFSKNRYLQWIVGISLVSLMMSIIGVYTHQVITFYLLPTRAWELLFGSFLSLEVIPKLESNVQRNLVSFIGLSLIIFSICFYTESTLFPGVAALAPVLGASFIIHSGKGGASIVKKLLSYKPIVYIGLISYSLYLWHWPLIVFSKYLIMRELTFFETLGIIITTFIISVISLKFIEKPFRVNYPLISNRKIFVISSFIMSMSSIIGLIIYYQNGMPYRSAANKDVLFVQRDWNKEWVLNSRKYNTSMDFPQIGSQHTHPSFIFMG